MLSRIAAWALGTRWLARAPIAVYRAGLGFLFGSRLLMLEHLGRTSGVWRQVVLEVVDRPAAGAYVVVSGFGASAQWYRNVVAHPRVRVSVGRRSRVPADATVLDAEACASVLRRYQKQHPVAWAALEGAIEAATHRPVSSMPMVRIQLHQA
jgi:deazaflavin-dependent oxidoreductase (nitroreductase family)